MSSAAARASAAILRDRTGGNPFFLRETWLDLERHGGVAALRGPQRVPTTLGDTVAARLAGLGAHLRESVELAAVIGDGFDLPTLVGAGTADRSTSMDAVDAAVAVGLVEPVAGTADRYGFVHSLTRQAVLDRLPHTRCTALHARVAQTLEARGDPALTPRIAHHYLAAHVLGFHEQALRHATAAARQAVHSLAFEEAALWFDRAASLPETPEDVRAQLWFEAAANHVRAGDFARARCIYERLTTTPDPLVRLEAAMGLEEAVARPGVSDGRAADLLGTALTGCALAPDDPRHVRARGSLGRALAFAGRVDEGRAVGSAGIEAARRSGDRPTLVHVLKTSLWHGLTPAWPPSSSPGPSSWPGCAPRRATARRAASPPSTGRSSTTSRDDPTTSPRPRPTSTGRPRASGSRGTPTSPGASRRAGRSAAAISPRPSSGPRRPCRSGRRSASTPPTAPTACRCS